MMKKNKLVLASIYSIFLNSISERGEIICR
jgi:hypothetical protein